MFEAAPPKPDPKEGCEPQNDHHNHAVEAVFADRVACRPAEFVGNDGHERRPGDAACGVPEEESPPRHVRDARQPRRGHTEECDEAPEEDGLRTVLGEESLGRRQRSVREGDALAAIVALP